MDRSHDADQRAPYRFPRPRGDGPDVQEFASVFSLVSPPTRGWTFGFAHQRQDDLGFPAHAGMDPASILVLIDLFWFPRPRGDGPPRETVKKLIEQVSPPTRGWTAMRRSITRTETAVSPPTRGWTICTAFANADRRGFPAHAGMDLRHRVEGGSGRWFPRPRGDGPSKTRSYAASQMVSPPTRGWTLPWRGGCAPCCGFPAHAGMDPSSVPSACWTVGFPRPRGDGPRTTSAGSAT